MKKLFTLALAAAGLLFVAGCTKEGAVADGQLSYSFQAMNMSASLGATGTASGAIVPALSNGSITWTTASANVAKIEFSAKKAGTAISLESKDVYGINALKPDSLSGSVPIVSGTYENVRVKLSLAASAGKPPFVLNGTYTEATGTKIPVIVVLNQTQDIVLETSKLEVAAATYVAKVTLEMNNLVKGLTANDFGQTTRTSPNNTILVNSTTNAALYGKLVANLAATASVSISKK